MANTIIENAGTTIFETMSRLAVQHQAVNLGQGFPDSEGCPVVRQAAAEALLSGYNQYPPMMGLPALREAMAAHEKSFYGFDGDPNTNILVTSGATEALAASFLALLNPGDEVIVFEPFYDAYDLLIRRAGGVPKYVTLLPPQWDLDFDALEAQVTDKTKAIILNTPHNPTGRVYNKIELDAFGMFCAAHNLVVISDEVYEHLVFDGARHISLLEIDTLRDRVIKISSAGKTFSLTGIKVGMITAHADLIKLVGKAHQYLTFTTPPNLQVGVAAGLTQDKVYFETLAHSMAAARDHLFHALQSLGFHVLPAQGGYFVSVDMGDTQWAGRDVDFAQWLTIEAGVTVVPVSGFYAQSPNRNLVRFCFAKSPVKIDEAISRLNTHKSRIFSPHAA